MIRNIKLKNFVHFKEEQSLNFDNGSYFFIGQNESGKSCMFEALRRCMSTSKSMGMSSSHVPDKHSLVTCDFDLSDTEQAKSGLLRIPKNSIKDIVDDMFVKFVFKIKRHAESTCELFMDIVKEVPGSWAVNKVVGITDETVDDFKKELLDDTFRLIKDFSLEWLQNSIEKAVKGDILKRIDERYIYNEKTPCEQFLIQHIDSAVVIVYPTRAIATGQWTKSMGSRQAPRSQVENEITQRSEIMAWYFGRLSSNEIDTTEREDVRKYFRTITNNSSFMFLCEENTIKVQENDHSEKHQLIKVPDGYFEAKHCAILLAFKQHKTICIEEAGKGMHPQMIERLRDLVFKQIDNKVVITTSHSQSMVSAWNIPRIFFFRKIRDRKNEDDVTFTVIDGNSILPEAERKTSRIVTSQSFSGIFFARRVLYVEGDGDFLFMSVLKEKLLNDHEYIPTLIQEVDKSLERDTFNRFMYSLQIIPLHGELNKVRFRKVSKALKLKHFFVLDYDAIMKKHTYKQDSKTMDQRQESGMGQLHVGTSEHNADQFLEDFELNHLKNEDIRTDVACLEKGGIFVWKKNHAAEVRKQGTIERALIELVESNDKEHLKTVFDSNYVKLQWDPNTRTQSSLHKFASNRHLTIEHVEKIIETVLDCCLNGKGVDILRLVNFLIRASIGAYDV